MSKFIRTKDGIYEEQETVGCLKFFELYTVGNARYNLCRTDELWNKLVIKEADTIDELCDELVLIEEDYPTLLEELYFKRRMYLRKNEYQFFSVLPEKPIIYGAIWTDKGLIYVAKMNEKGELELI